MANNLLDQAWKPLFDKYDYHGQGKISIINFSQILKESRLYEESRRAAGLQLQAGMFTPAPATHKIVWTTIAEQDGQMMISYEQFLSMISDLELHKRASPCYIGILDFASSTLVPRRERRSFIRTHLLNHTGTYEGLFWEAPFTFTMTALEIMIFLFYFIFHWSDLSATTSESLLVLDACKREQLWRLITSVFMHSGLWHIAMNAISQLYCGLPLELVYGPWRVAAIYVAGAIGGSLVGALTMAPNSIALGASGAIYALFGAYFGNLSLIWHELTSPIRRLICLLVLTLVQLIIIVGLDMIFNLSIGHWCHFGGALTGFLISPLILNPVLTNKANGNMAGRLRRMCLITLMLLVVVIALANVAQFTSDSYQETCSMNGTNTTSSSIPTEMPLITFTVTDLK